MISISHLVNQSERNGSWNEYRQSVHGNGLRRNGPQGDADADADARNLCSKSLYFYFHLYLNLHSHLYLFLYLYI